jgi:ribose 5-phosphate isomerase B
MRIAVSSDERTGVADALVAELRLRGHEPVVHGALADGERAGWAWASEAAARDVAEGRADQAVVCCWTGTGASIAANKVPGIRAALAWNIETAKLARQHNNAQIVAIGARQHSLDEAAELAAAFVAEPFSEDPRHQRRIDELAKYEKTHEPPALPRPEPSA